MERDSDVLADLRKLRSALEHECFQRHTENLPAVVTNSAHRVKVVVTLKDEEWRDICKIKKLKMKQSWITATASFRFGKRWKLLEVKRIMLGSSDTKSNNLLTS
jgi:hypothetical protein